jgi:hypothetical protein
MQRRITVRGVALGATLAVGATVAPTDAEAEGPAKVAPERTKVAVKAGDTREVQFKESKFRATQEQQDAYEALPQSVKDKLKPSNGATVMSADEMRELAQISKAALGGRVVDADKVKISTVMCPW